MIDDAKRYQIDGNLADAQGNGASANGSFEVDYGTGAISNINLTVGGQTFNTGGLSSSTLGDGTTEYNASFGFTPPSTRMNQRFNVSYNTKSPGQIDNATYTYTLFQGGNTQPQPDTYTGQRLQVSSTTTATGRVECLTPGTRIAVPGGERPVESLCVGDLVLTASGEAVPVRWIGRRRLSIATHPRPELVQPVRVVASAFAPGLPRRPLVISPGHGLLFDDVLIPAGELVNGRTVTRLNPESVEYLHIELDRHDIVLAEGLPVESYLDVGHRGDFDGGAATTLHPCFAAVVHEAACRPLALAGPKVEAARARLAARTGVTMANPRKLPLRRLFGRRAG